MDFDVNQRLIYKCKHGSHAYNLNTPTSDIDYKGVAIPPISYLFGYLRKFDQAEKYVSKGHDCDEVIYDLSKFIKLCADCNPNVIEVVFVDEEDILFINETGKLLRANKDLFVSAKAFHTFSGYAHAQLKRIKGHRNYLLNPPKTKPERKDFRLPEDSKISRSEMGAYDDMLSRGEKFDDHVMVLLQREKQYANAKREWDQYQNWKKTRNKERAAMEAESGYDRKHATHLIRLLRMGHEILSGKGVIVKRPDREELLEIRNGGWTYEQVIEHAKELDDSCLKVYEQLKETPAEQRIIPLEPNRKKIDELCQELQLHYNAGELTEKLKKLMPL